jgi:HEAT repeat protein
MSSTMCLLSLSISIFITTPLGATPVQQKEEETILAGLGSAEWETRYKTLERVESMPATDLKPKVRDALIHLLETEAHRRKALVEKKISFQEYLPPGAQASTFADYYQALIDVVAGLHDERALPMLVDYISQPSSFDVELANYGTRVLDLVLARLEASTQDEVQAAMADVLAKMLIKNREDTLEPELPKDDLERIKKSLRPVLSSPNWWTRLDGAFALAQAGDKSDRDRLLSAFSDLLERPRERQFVLQKFLLLPDAEFVPLPQVKRIAETDDFKVDLTNPYARKKYTTQYPIRQLAREVLEKFSKKE